MSRLALHSRPFVVFNPSNKEHRRWFDDFKRYSNVFTASYQTHDGTPVDPETWTLEKHFEYFKHLKI